MNLPDLRDDYTEKDWKKFLSIKSAMYRKIAHYKWLEDSEDALNAIHYLYELAPEFKEELHKIAKRIGQKTLSP